MSIELRTTPIRILVVDNSAVTRELLVQVLSADPELHVVGVAADGEGAVASAERLRPDVILMDAFLPKLDGNAATRRIMTLCPTRVVMMTAATEAREVAATFQAMETGALTVIAKPTGPGQPGFAAAEMVRTVKAMSEIPVVTRWIRREATNGTTVRNNAIRLVAIGASTGGPVALKVLLSGLGRDFLAPIIIVQHISEGFTTGFAEWLADAADYPVQVAVAGAVAMPGIAYVAPSGRHVEMVPAGTIRLMDAPAEHGVRPSASHLFRTAAMNFGSRVIGILLTGMGRDGAEELRTMRLAGAVTIAQDRESSVVYGMPAEALKLDAATYVMSPDKMAGMLRDLVGQNRGR